MREREICGKSVMWLALGLLFFLCAGMGIMAVEGKASEGETDADDIIIFGQEGLWKDFELINCYKLRTLMLPENRAVDIQSEAYGEKFLVSNALEGELDEDNTDTYGLIYKLNDDRMTASVIGINKQRADVSNPEYNVYVPSVVLKGNNRYTVDSVEDYALESAKSVYLPDSVIRVGFLGVFPDYTLDSLHLGAGVQSIDVRNWKEIWIKELSVSEDNISFCYDGRVLYDKWKTSVYKFVDYGWEEDKERSCTIPDTVKRIGSGAFYRVRELEKIVINITETGIEIEPFAMEECTAEIVYNSTDKNIKVLNDKNMDEDGWLYSCSEYTGAKFRGIDWERYEYVEDDIDIWVPNKVIKAGKIYTVKEISLDPHSTMEDPNAYKSNDKIKGKLIFHIGSNIEDAIFHQINSSKLYCVVETDNKYLSSGNGSLMNKIGTKFIHFYDGDYMEDDVYQIPEGVTEIGGSAFYGTKIKSVIFPNSVKRADTYAFYGSAISQIDLNQVTRVEYYCFASCNNLREVKISESLDIDWHAFAWNHSLENIYIPTGSKLSPYAFSGSGIQNAVIGSNCSFRNPKEDSDIFYDCSLLKTLILPEDWKKIPSAFLCSCDQIRKLYIPDSVGIIENGSFRNCKITLYGSEGSVAADCDDGRQVKFKSLKEHTHRLEDVTFFSYDKWAVTGKYCQECGYGTECRIVDIETDVKEEDLPKLLVQIDEYSEIRELDENNVDDDYLVYKLDEKKKTASVTGINIADSTNRNVDIPSKVIKNSVEYTVESIEDYALRRASGIHMSDTIRKVGCLRSSQLGQLEEYSKIYLGAGVAEMDEEVWAYTKVNVIEVSEKNPNYSCEGRAFYDKDKTKLLKYTDYKWGEDEERTYTVPETVNWIGAGAFYNIKELDQINIKTRDDLKISPTAFEGCTATIHYINPEISSTPDPEQTAEPTDTPEPPITTPTKTPDSTEEPEQTAEPTDTPEPEEPPSSSTGKPIPAPDVGTTQVSGLATPSPVPVKDHISTSISVLIPTASPEESENFTKDMLIISQFRVELTAKNYVSLSWNKNQYVSGYRIYRAKKKSGTYKMIKDLSGTAVAYTDKTAGKNKSYYYRMEAYKTLSDKTITGKRTSVSFVNIPAFTAPKIMIRKGKMGKIRFISIQFKKYKGKYADIYVAQGSNKFKKLKLVSNKIAKYKKKFKIQYKVKNKILRVRVRTFDKKKKKKYYSSFSKMVKIKV